MIVTDDVYIEHFGKKGMKWGVRRAAKKEAKATAKATAKAAHEKKVKEFRDSVIKDIGTRSPNELFSVRGSQRGVTVVMTGKEFVQNARMGMPFDSVASTGFTINDGR